jgi:hypothetical protein
MVEIKIEKKTLVWPWVIVIILIIAGLVYFFGYRNGDGTDTATTFTADTTASITADNTSAPASYIDGPVSDYIRFVNAGPTMGLDHDYTNGALTRLVNAIRYKATAIGHDVTADLDQIKEHADQITDNPYETSHAQSIRGAVDILTSAMQKMQQDKYPNLASVMTEVKIAAIEINPKVPTLEQRDAVKNFFDKSAQLLQGMN